MECAVPAGCMRLSPCYSTSCGRQPAWKLVRSTARHFASAPLTISQLERSLAVHRRQATDSAPNLSKLGHLRRFYSALTGPIMVKALLLFGDPQPSTPRDHCRNANYGRTRMVQPFDISTYLPICLYI